MKNPPPRIGLPASANEIASEMQKLLRAAGVGDQVPTPKAAILACTRLVETGEIDLDQYKQSLADRFRGFFDSAISKILGLLDFHEHVIYVDPAIHASRKLFVTYHEVTHRVLPWQQPMYAADNEVTLDPRCRDLFEAEANFGAAEILFQGTRFDSEARDLPLTVGSALYLANRYDASAHSALRRFAERNHRPCMLFVLKETCRRDECGLRSFYVVYTVESAPFVLRFGDPFGAVSFINPDHPLSPMLNSGQPGTLEVLDIRGLALPCSVEVFDNHHHIFLLVYPKNLPGVRTRVTLNG